MFKFIVTAAKGLDELLQQEILTLLSNTQNTRDEEIKCKLQPGQVSFEGTLEDAYRICLCSRLANRVLLVLAHGDAQSAEALYTLAKTVDWPTQFSHQTTLSVHFVGHSKAINNSQFGALKVKDAIVDSFTEDGQERPSIDRQFPEFQVHVRLKRDRASICIDLSGSSLHQRGYRQASGDAPLKEQLAAAILYRSNWTNQQEMVLLDPMCGSGTIAIEAAMIAANIAPNLHRKHWGFTHWFGHQASLFEGLQAFLQSQQQSPKNKIYAYDISTSVLDIARANAELAGVAEYIEFKQCDALNASVKEKSGYIVSNPPYGERLDDYVSLLPFYSKLGEHFKSAFASWHIALLCSNEQLLKALKLRTKKRYKLFNGKLETLLACYYLDEQNIQSFTPAPSSDEFSNRLTKNINKLRSWLKRTNTNAYRVYDADLPNYNFAIDRSADWVIVQEYAPPKNIPEAVAQERLAKALLHLPGILSVARDKIVLKVRKKQAGKAQYEKNDEKKSRFIVHEHGAQFYINPTDYLDVGLFLDHRITRQLFAQDCQHKHVLNLFCYTGSVSVHAAMAGAASVTSVDMSTTYINWAKDNFLLNKIESAHEFIQADCLKWLNSTAINSAFDRIFIDPPTFSNSKKMADNWDVQRDHVALLTQAKKLLSNKGKIYFSNNLRSFKLDNKAIEDLGFTVDNISHKTIDEDFKRNPKIHHCWILSL